MFRWVYISCLRFNFDQIWRAERHNLFLIGRDKEVVFTDSVWLRRTGQMCTWWWVRQPKILKHSGDWQKHLEGIVNGIDAWAKVMKNEFTAPPCKQHTNWPKSTTHALSLICYYVYLFFFVFCFSCINTCLSFQILPFNCYSNSNLKWCSLKNENMSEKLTHQQKWCSTGLTSGQRF